MAPAFQDLLGSVLSAAREADCLAQARALDGAMANVTEAQAVPLLERIMALSETDRNRLLDPVFARLCQLYPSAVTPWVLRLPRSHNPSLSNHLDKVVVLSTWARLVPEKALSVAQQDPLAFARVFARRSSPGNGASEPPTIGYDSLPAGPLRERAAAYFVGDECKDVTAAWRVAREEVHGELLREVAWRLADQALSSNEADAGELLHVLSDIAPDLPGGVFGHRTFDIIVNRIVSRVEPEDVANWALNLPETLRDQAAITASAAWAEKAPRTALAWAWKNGVSLDREVSDSTSHYNFSLLDSALRRAPDETVVWLTQLPPGAGRDRFITHSAATGGLSDEWKAALRAALDR